MKMKKVLAGSALSLALLCSAAPAFAAGPADTPSPKSTEKEVTALATIILNGSGPDYPSSIYQDGVLYYLDNITFHGANGTWTAVYKS
ncbi:transcriptional regulator [Bacillus siamensis]|uniref:transcriptional regulator n=1 Tax=Bacillus siamensis TaxID=659243 RepID=UPI002E203929|nr:transcriptional regulator [Bacillus siamensis]MED5097731.1 transcriptional regulator [Bacillus siamensis]